MVRDCRDSVDTCGSCGSDHRMGSCDRLQQGDRWCISCRSTDHCSWDRDCPEKVCRQAQINVRFLENNVLFFPTNEAWRQVTGHTRKVHVPAMRPAPDRTRGRSPMGRGPWDRADGSVYGQTQLAFEDRREWLNQHQGQDRPSQHRRAREASKERRVQDAGWPADRRRAALLGRGPSPPIL